MTPRQVQAITILLALVLVGVVLLLFGVSINAD